MKFSIQDWVITKYLTVVNKRRSNSLELKLINSSVTEAIACFLAHGCYKVVLSFFQPLYLYIRMCILHTVLYTFLLAPTMRIKIKIKIF